MTRFNFRYCLENFSYRFNRNLKKTPDSLVSVLSGIEVTPPLPPSTLTLHPTLHPRTQITSDTMNQAQNIINFTCVPEVANVADISCNLFACRHDGWW